ncbi:hypothetical protein GCM10010398_63010 [Streptomyces fimbriatus]
MVGGIGEEHADLAVLDPSGGSGVLPLHPGRTAALLQKSGLVDDQQRALAVAAARLDGMNGDEQLLNGRAYGHNHDVPNP